MAVVRQERMNNHAAFVWSVADLLRGDYKQSEYGRVILPLTVLRRLDCVLEPTKAEVLETAARLEGQVQNLDPVLGQVTGVEHVYNTSTLDFRRVLDDPNSAADQLKAYIAGFSEAVREVIEHFDFGTHIDRLAKANLLYKVVGKFAEIDLHSDAVSNIEMGYLYEELIRRLSELSNETAGEHSTPREVIRLMVNLLFAEDGDALSKPGVKRTLFDPACGTGGMLSVAEDHLRELNPSGRLEVFGQELNGEAYATCRADMMLKGQDASHIAFGNSLSEDAFEGATFDYLLANPPFGVEWRKVEYQVKDEAEIKGFAGRFGAGLPRINDGSLLFLQHMISKMKPADQGGSRLAIVFNGSPLFIGAAGSGESEIRRWIIENDWLDAIVALPDQLFYNTGISTYLWIVTNRKTHERRGKVHLIDARKCFTKMRKSLGNKRKKIADDHIAKITREYMLPETTRIVTVETLLANSGGATRIEPWMFDPAISQMTHVRLSALAELVRPEPIAMSLPLLDILSLDSEPLVSTALDREADPGRRYAECRGGDVVGRGRRWSVLPPTFGPAATSLDVLRPRSGSQLDPHLLALWLNSDECAQQLAGITSPRIRADIMVPRKLHADDSLATAAQEVSEMRVEARRLLDTMLEDPFKLSGEQPAEDRLLMQASTARAIRSLLQPLDDVVHRAEWQYPYQVAKSARDYRLSVSIDRTLEAGLLLAESLIRTIGVFAASIQLACDQSRKSELLAFFSGGISTGSWLELVRLAQRSEALTAYPEIESISFGKRGLGEALNNCVKTRNELKHATGMLSTSEREERLAELDPLLTTSLELSTWLGLYENLWVRSCEYTASGFEIHGLRINGSHPDWEPITMGVADPVLPTRLYLRTPNTALLDLSPFAAIAACSMCKREELYVLDRIQAGSGQARSVRDHRIAVEVE